MLKKSHLEIVPFALIGYFFVQNSPLGDSMGLGGIKLLGLHMKKQEEEFVHFTSCISSLNNAWVIINKIKEQKNNPLIGPAFRFALIEYSKPYRQSFGNKRWKLDDSDVPEEMKGLHIRITNARDQVHAHTDLTVLDAKLYIKETEGHRFSGIVQNKISGIEELSNIDDIIKLIEGTLDNMYIKEKEFEAALP